VAEISSGRILVAEELENGLHPSQAALLLERLKSVAGERKVRTVATTHSPAILDALNGPDHESVMVSTRDDEGWSRVDRLTDCPDYFEVVGRTSLGDSAVHDRLRPGAISPRAGRAALDAIFS
jgi:predicted ATPase